MIRNSVGWTTVRFWFKLS